ncbi:MAG TPA: nuclear transport factor 2 family protein [Acidimicrobiales bacterium]|jgi:hypothetical protein|nr:nuclear transport factor 2 family protein [Acidimicrobiales bacterium]
MPWFPDFAGAVELVRRQTRTAGLSDPVAQYLDALSTNDPHALEDVWPGEVVIYDPRAGEIRGHRQLRQFIRQNQSWLAERQARIETVASTVVAGRAVVELMAHLAGDQASSAWPVAVVAESPDDRSVVFRTYCSQWPIDGRRHLRPPILKHADVRPSDVVGRFQAALEVGDADAIVDTFAPDGYGSGTRRASRHPSRHIGAPLLLHHVLQRWRRHRPAALPGHGRRGPLRRGIQLRPVGQP